MPITRRELLTASVAGAAILKQGTQAFAAPAGGIEVSIDAAKAGEPVTPLIFGGYMEPATTRVWAEMLTDRKFVNPIASAAAAPPAGGELLFMRRFCGEPFRPVGPAGTVEMDTVRPFVGKHSPRIKLDGSEPRGIQQSRLRLGTRQVLRRPRVSCRRPWRQSCSAAGVGSRRQRFADHPHPGAHRTSTGSSRSSSPRRPIRRTGGWRFVGTGSGTFHIGTVSLMPADNLQGFHAGMIRLFKEAGFRMAKWPGGNFVSAYDFYDGLGDPGQASAAARSRCGVIESNRTTSACMSSSPSAGCSAPNPI